MYNRVVNGQKAEIYYSITDLKQIQNMRITKVLVVLLAILSITGCRKDIDGVPTETIIEPNPPYLHATAFDGLVIDENGDPVSNAAVSFTNLTTLTDNNGYFKFEDIALNERGSLITIEKQDFFKGYKFVFPSDTNHAYQKIMLISKSDAHNFNASNGGVIEELGTSIRFPSNSIIYEDSNLSYSGDVIAYFHWYNPELSSTLLSMPGDLRGIDKENKFKSLGSYGMVAVELYTDSGEKLNLAAGSTAEVSMQAPSFNELPGILPMWYLDDTGIWREEGEASLINGNYVGQVSHFSFWNCDYPYDLVQISGIIQDPNGIAISNALIKINIQNSTVCGSGFTNGEGAFSGLVPKDVSLEITVFDECGNSLYQGPLGSFAEDTNLPPIVAAVSNELITIEGTVLCEGVPITAGYVKLTYGENDCVIVDISNDGTFSSSRLLCSFEFSNISLFAINTDLGTTSDEITIDSLGQNLISVGTIDACSLEVDEWLSLRIEGQDLGTVYDVGARFGIGGLSFYGSGIDGGAFFDLIEPTLGDNQPTTVSFDNVWSEYISCNDENCSNMNINFSTLDNFENGYIQGIYSGTLLDPNGNPVQVEGDFRIKFDLYTPIAKIYGFAWEDINLNGIYDNGEPPLTPENIFIYMNGSIIKMNYDDENNFFGYVEANTDFYLRYILESNESTTLYNEGSNESIDNDFDPEGLTETLQLEVGQEYRDFGLGIITFDQLDCVTFPTVGSISLCEFTGTNIGIEVNSGSPPYSYEWNTGEITQSIEVFDEGIYSVTVTDANNSQCATEIEVFSNPIPEIESSQILPSCGNSNGSIQIVNTNNYSQIFWSELDSNEFTIENLGAGTYFYEIYDQFGCAYQGEITLNNQFTTIGNQVFIDKEGGQPGQFDAGDLAKDSVTVNLLDAESLEIVASQLTDDLGNYLFQGEYEGNYIIEVMLPIGFEFTEQLGELADTWNSDINPQTGRTQVFTVECGEQILYIDAGLIE